MFIKVNDNDYIDFDLDVFEENDYRKWNIHFEMLTKTLGIKNFIGNKIELSNFNSEEEIARFIEYFILDSTYSVKSLDKNVITITYKPYMQTNDFKIICSSRVFDEILKMMNWFCSYVYEQVKLVCKDLNTFKNIIILGDENMSKPKSLYPQRELKVSISKAMLVLMFIMTILLFYIAFVITVQSVYCIPMA